MSSSGLLCTEVGGCCVGGVKIPAHSRQQQNDYFLNHHIILWIFSVSLRGDAEIHRFEFS